MSLSLTHRLNRGGVADQWPYKLLHGRELHGVRRRVILTASRSESACDGLLELLLLLLLLAVQCGTVVV